MLKYCTYFFDERVVIGSYTNKTLTENDWRVVDKTIRCWARYRFEKNWSHIHGADLKVRYLLRGESAIRQYDWYMTVSVANNPALRSPYPEKLHHMKRTKFFI